MPSSLPELFSVVIPTHNRAYAIIETLDSVKAQTYRPIELLIVDDGSEDDTREVVREWVDQLPKDPAFRVRYLQQANAGVSNARNHGLREARGEWVQFFDSDDIMYPQRLQRLADTFRACSADIVITGYDVFDSHSQHILKRHYGYEDARQLEHVALHEIVATTLRAAFRRDLLERAGPWNESMRMSEDTEYIERVLLLAQRPWGLRAPLAAQRRGLGDHRHRAFDQACRVDCKEAFLRGIATRADVSLHAKRSFARQLARLGCLLYLKRMPALGRRCSRILARQAIPLDNELRFRLCLLRCGFFGSLIFRCVYEETPIGFLRNRFRSLVRRRRMPPGPKLAEVLST